MRAKLKWNKPAQTGTRDYIRYIGLDSVYHARQVSERVREATEVLLRYPAMHPPDKFKTSNDGTFRAFTQDSLRISYRVFKTSIHIIRVRHVAQKPLYY